MLMLKPVATCIALAVLSGCALPALDADAISALKGKTIVRAAPPTGKMMMTTPAAAAVGVAGLAGGVAAAAGGAKAGGVAPVDLPDPSLAMAAQLAAHVDRRYGTKTIDAVLTQPFDGMPELATRGRPLAEYTLQVFTNPPAMMFYVSEPSRYRIVFTTVATLMDNKTQKKVATGVCVYEPASSAGAATYDQMLANNGERAKRDLAAGTQHCAQKLQQDMFSF